MNFIKSGSITVLLIVLLSTNAQGQFNFFKYGFLEYVKIQWMTDHFLPKGIFNHNFKHRLVIANFASDTLVVLHKNETLSLTQNLGQDVYLEDHFYPESTHISGFQSGQSFKIKKMKIVEILDDSILFVARIKKQGQNAHWIEIVLNKSDLSGIYVGNSTTDIPLVTLGSLIGVTAFIVVSDYIVGDE